jgi:DHA1 family bicyclomycin/chloramphenicol resistance-like MFS transporter
VVFYTDVHGILILLQLKLVLPTFKPDTSISLKPKPIITNFLTIIKEPQFYTYAFAGSIAFSGLFTNVAASLFYLWIFLKLMQNLRLDIRFYVIEFY